MRLNELEYSKFKLECKIYWANKTFEEKKQAILNGFSVESPEGKVFKEMADEFDLRNR